MAKEISLVELPTGIEAIVKHVRGGIHVKNRLKVLGVRAGAKIKKVSGGFARGPVVITIGPSQTALGYGVSSKVIVEIAK